MSVYFKTRFILLSLALFFGGIFAAMVVFQAALARDYRFSSLSDLDEEIVILESNERYLRLEYKTPSFQVQTKMINGQKCQYLELEEFGATADIGWPQLPLKGFLFGIPHGQQPAVELLYQEEEIIPGEYNLCPVGKPRTVDHIEEQPRFPGMEYIREPGGFLIDHFYPANIVELGEIGEIRSQQVAQLLIQPFQYNPVSGKLRHYSKIRLQIEFNSSNENLFLVERHDETDQAFDQLLGESLLNFQTAKAWRRAPQPSSSLHISSPLFTSQAYKISVEQNGIYEISYTDLLSAGVPVNEINPITFKVRNQGEELAIYVTGEGDGTFDEDDYLLFYGQRIDSKFTNTNVYWLTWGGADGERMPVVDGVPAGSTFTPTHFKTNLHLEQDHYYQSSRSSGSKNDHWYWDILQTSSNPQNVYTFTLDNLSSIPVSATLSGLFYSYSASPQHHTSVSVNGNEVTDSFWAPGGEYSFTQDLPQSYLQEGVNTITLDGSGTSQIFFINWFNLDYYHTYTADSDAFFFDGEQVGDPLYIVGGFTDPDIARTDVLFDITDVYSTTRIVNAGVQHISGTYQISFTQSISNERAYAVFSPDHRMSPTGIFEDTPSNLMDPGNAADYIIITHQEFYTDILPLAEHRSSQGLRVQVVNFQDVIDEFNDGIHDPEAIRSFLSYAYSNWTAPAPGYVLLVGDGNFDFKDNLGRGEPNYIPPYLVDVDPWMGETASDNRYVSLNGPYDILPDMHIGRLPVKTPAEAQAVVTKILDYEADTSEALWNQQVLFVADNADNDGEFPALSDAVADNYLPPPYQPAKIYYGENYPILDEAQNAITETINLGNLIVSYIGHASPEFWSFEPLLHKDSIETFTNANKLSFFVPMTCLEGYFINPSPPGFNFSSLGEMVVRAPDKGGVASWSPTGLGVAVGHDILEKSLFEAIFYDDITQLGPATAKAKYDLYANGLAFRELIDTYLLFGDPYTGLHVFVIDTLITGSPPNPSKSADASFSFSSNLPQATFECQLDGGGYLPCASPASYFGLGDGQHTFHVRALDTLGKPDTTPASYTWVIDTGTNQPLITYWPLIYR